MTKLWTPRTEIEPLPDGARIAAYRGYERAFSRRIGPNMVHAFITHPDGWITDLGESHNLLTTKGRDLYAAASGAAGINAGGSVTANLATATSATSLTNTNAAYTVDAYKGWIVVAEDSTNTPVWANIGSNSATVLTVDSWKNADDSAGNTPGSTANYFILPACRPRYMAITTDSGAASAADTTLASEATTNGAGRALATYAFTPGATTFTLSKVWSITGTLTALHKIGLLTAATLTAAGILVFEAVMNLDATVGNGDSLTATDTVTSS